MKHKYSFAGVLILLLIAIGAFLFSSPAKRSNTASGSGRDDVATDLKPHLPQLPSQPPNPTSGSLSAPTYQPKSEIEKKLGVRAIIAQTEIVKDSGEPIGEQIIVETDFKHSLVRIERSFRNVDETQPAGHGGDERFEREVAMVADYVLVKKRRDVDMASFSAAVESRGFSIQPTDVDNNLFSVAVTNPEDSSSIPDTLDQFEAHLADVTEYAEPDVLFFIDNVVPNDPQFGAQWGLHNSESIPSDIQAPRGWLTQHSASNITIAVTDTGVRYTHEDLIDNMWRNLDEIPENGIDDDLNGIIDDVHGIDSYEGDGDPFDRNGHGTHVAGIAGARGNNGVGIAGVAWNVQLMACQFMSRQGVGTALDAATAIHYALDHGADIINASWGARVHSYVVEDAVARAADEGVVFVASAGNSRYDVDINPHYPACLNQSNVVAVAATNRRAGRSHFSNYGQYRVHLAAPGESILSCYSDSDNAYQALSGTSMSAPMVAGALALIKQEFPDEKPEELIRRLLSSTAPKSSLRSTTLSGGMLDLFRALIYSSPVPDNDDLAQAHELSGYNVNLYTSTCGATREVEDPESLLGSQTLWFTWSPPVSGFATVAFAAETSASLTLYIYGADGSLQPAEELQGREGSTRKYVDADTTYTIGIAADTPGGEGILLSVLLPPENDFFADATLLTGAVFQVEGNNRGATREPWENDARTGSGKTVWWKWTAPQTTRQVVNTFGSRFDTLLSVYTANGLAPPDLTRIGFNDDRFYDRTSEVAFQATEGETYYFAVDGYRSRYDESGPIQLYGYGEFDIVIWQQPQSAELVLGINHTLVAAAFSNLERTIRWYHNGTLLPGEVNERLEIFNVQPEHLGDYYAVISTPSNSVTSETATLTELISAPRITHATDGGSYGVGATALLQVQVSGSLPMSFQWYKNNALIEGATTDALYFQSIDEQDEGFYHVVVNNSQGSDTSETMTVDVTPSPFESWQWISHDGQGWPIRDIIEVDGTYYAIASSGYQTKVLTSLDGSNWIGQLLPEKFAGQDIAYGNGRFVILGSDSKESFATAYSYVSTDGVDWSIHATPLEPWVFSVAFGNGVFVAIADSGYQRWYSTDGLNWTFSGQSSEARKVEYLGGYFVAFDTYRSSSVRYSSDGINWTLVDAGTTLRPTAIGYHNGAYHLWTYSEYLTSPDLANWTNHGDPNGPPGGNAGWASHDGTQWITGSKNRYSFYSSTDGLNWTEKQITLPDGTYKSGGEITELLAHNGKVIVGSTIGLLDAASDFNDIDSHLVVPLRSGSSYHLNFSEGEFFIWDSYAAWTRGFTSHDGENWESFDLGYASDGYRNEIFRAGGYYWVNTDRIFGRGFRRGRSLDANAMQDIPNPPGEQIRDIRYLNGNYLAVISPTRNSSSATLFHSADGLHWSEVPEIEVNIYIKPLVYKNKFWIFRHSMAWSSSDGLIWQSSPIPFFGLDEVTMHEGELFAPGSYKKLWRSPDGLNWSEIDVNVPFSGFNRLFSYDGALVVGSGIASDGLYYSYDLENWVKAVLDHGANRYMVGNGVLVGIKEDTIVRSGQPSSAFPVCNILSPTQGTYKEDINQLEAVIEANDPDGSIDRIECYVDDELVAILTSPPYRFPLGGNAGHSYVLQARAFDNDGQMASDSVGYQLAPPGIPEIFTAPYGTAWTFYFQGYFYSDGIHGVLRSPDGVQWEETEIANFEFQSAITNEDGTLLLLGRTDGSILYTHDGENWTEIPSFNTDYQFSEIQYHDGVFFRKYTNGAPGEGGTMASWDGIHWLNSGDPSSSTYFETVLIGDGPVFIGWDTTSLSVRRSVDGIQWQEVTTLARADTVGAAGGGTFIIDDSNTGIPDFSDNYIHISTDSGLTWSRTPFNSQGFSHLLYRGGVFYGGRIVSDTFYIHGASIDGINWTPVSLSVFGDILMLGNTFIAIGERHTWTSEDGINWTEHSNVLNFLQSDDNPDYYRISQGDGVMAVSSPNSRKSMVSSDGVTWTETQIGHRPFIGTGYNSDPRYRDIAKLGSHIYISSQYGPFLVSHDDGENWSEFSLPGDTDPSAIFYTTPQCILAFTSNGMYRTTDGINWTPFTVDLGEGPVDIMSKPKRDAYGEIFSYAGEYLIRTSDGINWTRQHIAPLFEGSGIYYSGEEFLVSGLLDGVTTYFSSFDNGDTWVVMEDQDFYTTDYFASNGVFIRKRGSSAHISQDGFTWETLNISQRPYGTIHTYDSGFLLNPSDEDDSNIYRSTDGVVWEPFGWRPEESSSLQFSNNQIFFFTQRTIYQYTDVDLAVSEIQCNPLSLGVGDALEATLVLANSGANAFNVEADLTASIYLSVNGSFGGEALLIDQILISAASLPEPGQEVELPFRVFLPDSVAGGEFHLGIRVDTLNVIQELDEQNNNYMMANALVTIPVWQLNVNTVGNGQVEQNVESLSIPHGSAVNLQTRPAKGSVFTGWSGDSDSQEGQLSFSISSNTTLTANFSDYFLLNTSVVGRGTIQIEGGSNLFAPDDLARLTALPAEGWTLLGWGEDAAGDSPTLDVVMDGDKTVTAQFIQSYSDWAASHFDVAGTLSSSSTTLSDFNNDADGDGEENWKEYASGSDPLDAQSKTLQSYEIAGDYLYIIYTRNTGAYGYSVSAEGSRDFKTWGGAEIQERIISSVDGVETYEARIPLNGSRGFIRVNTSQ